MTEERGKLLDALLAEVPVLFVAALWTIIAVMTKQSYIGLAGLAILYRRYTKKKGAEQDY